MIIILFSEQTPQTNIMLQRMKSKESSFCPCSAGIEMGKKKMSEEKRGTISLIQPKEKKKPG
jgi:hypothetical protein